MIVGGSFYQLDLYCEKCKGPSSELQPYGWYRADRSFVADTRAKAYKAARGEGWQIGKDATCPSCAKKKKARSNQDG